MKFTLRQILYVVLCVSIASALCRWLYTAFGHTFVPSHLIEYTLQYACIGTLMTLRHSPKGRVLTFVLCGALPFWLLDTLRISFEYLGLVLIAGTSYSFLEWVLLAYSDVCFCVAIYLLLKTKKVNSNGWIFTMLGLFGELILIVTSIMFAYVWLV